MICFSPTARAYPMVREVGKMPLWFERPVAGDDERRRCILPIDGFFEWKAITGQKARQPFAIAMKDGSSFGIAGLWENWREPASGEWVRTFAIITVPDNELVATIHDRMPAILHRADYDRWLGIEPDPRTAIPFRTAANVADIDAGELANER
jgi:putative SOS response-associated peptidase YedK